MAYSLFPGCSLDASAKTYRTSLDWTLEALGIEVKELPDWNCCGATSTHALDTPYVDAIPARNLAIADAEEQDILVACSACYHRLKRAQETLAGEATSRKRIESALGRPLPLKQQVHHLLQVLTSEALLDRIRQQRNDTWQNVRVGAYYGCLAVRLPGAIGFDNPENPLSMDHIVEATGAIAVDWPYKTRCCGASFSVTGPEYAQQLSDDILQMARRCHLDLLVTACPFCQYNLDLAQWNPQVQAEHSTDQVEQPIPIVFITQFLGAALGASFKQMGFEANLTGVEELKRLNRRISA